MTARMTLSGRVGGVWLWRVAFAGAGLVFLTGAASAQDARTPGPSRPSGRSAPPAPSGQVQPDKAPNERLLRESEERDKRREQRMQRVMRSICGRR